MLRVALAGKPNVGKSTFFAAATATDVAVENYPFTTIDPNRGITHVRTRCPCVEREQRCSNENCAGGKRYVPIELLDVAGLVPGAHEGRGLGNQFLDELSDADAIITVVDAAGSTNEEGEPVAVGTADPVAEVQFIETEMNEWLAGIIADNWEQVQRAARAPDFELEAALLEILSGVGTTEADLAPVLRNHSFPEDPQRWSDHDRLTLARAIRQRTKPILVVANKIDLAPAANVEALAELDRTVIPASAEAEQALRRAAANELVAYDPGDDGFEISGEPSQEQHEALEGIAELLDAYDGTGVQRALDTTVYELLNRITVYPVENETHWTDSDGRLLPDAFLLSAAATPVDLAYAVHSDIGESYIHAVDARSGRRISDDHELEEGDVIKIVSGAS